MKQQEFEVYVSRQSLHVMVQSSQFIDASVTFDNETTTEFDCLAMTVVDNADEIERNLFAFNVDLMNKELCLLCFWYLTSLSQFQLKNVTLW